MGPMLASAALRPVGPLGAAIVAGALVVMCAYLLGARERRRWGGRPPTAQEFLNSRHKMGRLQYSTAQWGPRVLIVHRSITSILAAVTANRPRAARRAQRWRVTTPTVNRMPA